MLRGALKATQPLIVQPRDCIVLSIADPFGLSYLLWQLHTHVIVLNLRKINE